MTGQSRGFGFVGTEDDSDADRAIDELCGTTLGGCNINVNEARERSGDGGGGAWRWCATTSRRCTRRLRRALRVRFRLAADVETCPKCGGAMRWLEATTDPQETARLMAAHGLGPQPPRRQCSQGLPNEPSARRGPRPCSSMSDVPHGVRNGRGAPPPAAHRAMPVPGQLRLPFGR